MTSGEQAGAGTPAPALIARSVSKTYPGVRALRRVNLVVNAQAIHGLVGENGSGKSTFVNVVSGAVAPDSGTDISLFGSPLPFGDPLAAQQQGIAHVHQELAIFPELTVLENVFVGSYRSRAALIDLPAMRAEFRDILSDIGIELDPRLLAGELSVADQTMVEIIRAVRRRVRLLILDEPTASLGPPERERLYALVRRLNRENAMTVIYISHDLDEVLDLTTTVTVFRDGEHILTKPTTEMSKHRMVDAMLGDRARQLAEAAEGGSAGRTGEGRAGVATLAVSGVTVPGLLTDVSLTAHEGEIVGIAGLVGAGRTTFLRALVGLENVSAGEFRLRGEVGRWPRDVPEALARGVALLPEDRKEDGLALDLSITDNVIQTDLRQVSRLRMIRSREAIVRAKSLLGQVGFRGKTGRAVRTLSGGNQQKVLLAKWLHRPPDVFLMDEPTRGIDVGAKAEILETLRMLADNGATIIMVSSEFEELVVSCDRVVLMARGTTVGELSGANLTVEAILNQLFSVESEAA
jgi:ABC-type sugar transport system ATPase subunit